VTFAGFGSALLCSVVLTVQRCPGGVVYESMPYKWLNFLFGDPGELRTRRSGVRISPGAPIKSLSIPVAWVTFYTGDMGDTFATKGFSALSIRHVS